MRHRVRTVCLAAIAVASLAATPRSQADEFNSVLRLPARALDVAQDRIAFEYAVQKMPVLERPDRFGHFYGNTVRRLHRRRVARQAAPTPVRPVPRQTYLLPPLPTSRR